MVYDGGGLFWGDSKIYLYCNNVAGAKYKVLCVSKLDKLFYSFYWWLTSVVRYFAALGCALYLFIEGLYSLASAIISLCIALLILLVVCRDPVNRYKFRRYFLHIHRLKTTIYRNIKNKFATWLKRYVYLQCERARSPTHYTLKIYTQWKTLGILMVQKSRKATTGAHGQR